MLRSNAYFLIFVKSCRYLEENTDMKKKILETKTEKKLRGLDAKSYILHGYIFVYYMNWLWSLYFSFRC